MIDWHVFFLDIYCTTYASSDVGGLLSSDLYELCKLRSSPCYVARQLLMNSVAF